MGSWICDYSVFLFDFDGLLVNTEPLHYEAYLEMVRKQGFPLNWSFERFCQEAHSRARGFFHGLQREYPHVFETGITQEMLYEEKAQCYLNLLTSHPVTLMPGVEELLNWLASKQLRRAVVTNSPRDQIELICARQPVLKTIPLWITREDYQDPKPAPDGYLEALKQLGAAGSQAVGFEDTSRGIKSLLAAGVDAVLVAPMDARTLSDCQSQNIRCLSSLSEALHSSCS